MSQSPHADRAASNEGHAEKKTESTELDDLYDMERAPSPGTAIPAVVRVTSRASKEKTRVPPVPPPSILGVREGSDRGTTCASTAPPVSLVHDVPIGELVQRFPDLESTLSSHGAYVRGGRIPEAHGAGHPVEDAAAAELTRRLMRLAAPNADMFNLSDVARTYLDTDRARVMRAMSNMPHAHSVSSLPLLGVEYESRLLGEAGVFPNPAAPHTHIRFPPCSNGVDCIGRRNGRMQQRMRIADGLLGFPPGHPGVTLSALVFPDEYSDIAGGRPLTHARMCILCYRVTFIDFVYAARWYNDGQMRGVVPDERRVQQLYANKVDCEDGYDVDFVLQPVPNAYDHVIAPMADFRYTALRMEQIPSMGNRWMVNQTIMVFRSGSHASESVRPGTALHPF